MQLAFPAITSLKKPFKEIEELTLETFHFLIFHRSSVSNILILFVML